MIRWKFETRMLSLLQLHCGPMSSTMLDELRQATYAWVRAVLGVHFFK